MRAAIASALLLLASCSGSSGATSFGMSTTTGDTTTSVIQGGLGGASPDAQAPIAHETTMQTGLAHEDGTLSMARAE